jgi:hypothetical protein
MRAESELGRHFFSQYTVYNPFEPLFCVLHHTTVSVDAGIEDMKLSNSLKLKRSGQ